MKQSIILLGIGIFIGYYVAINNYLDYLRQKFDVILNHESTKVIIGIGILILIAKAVKVPKDKNA